MDRRRKAIEQADNELVEKFGEGRIVTADYLEAIKISSGIHDATSEEVVGILEHGAKARFLAAGVGLAAARIAARLSPPPYPNETAREVIHRAARNGDKEAVRFLDCSSDEDFLSAFPSCFAKLSLIEN